MAKPDFDPTDAVEFWDMTNRQDWHVRELQQRGWWTEDMRTRIKRGDGSVQDIDELPDEMKARYRTAWELPQRSLVDIGAERGAFIDQSQSLNLFAAPATPAGSRKRVLSRNAGCTAGARAVHWSA